MIVRRSEPKVSVNRIEKTHYCRCRRSFPFADTKNKSLLLQTAHIIESKQKQRDTKQRDSSTIMSSPPSSNNNNNKGVKFLTDECVGTMLFHSSDLQELSESYSGTKDECVGTLLVHQSDVQGLSSSPPAAFPEVHMPQVNLRKRVTAGTLLVYPADLKTDEKPPHGETTIGKLQKRVTKALDNVPPSDDDDHGYWHPGV